MRLKFLSFSNLTLLVALSLSTVAAYYSIIGLTAIFAGAVIPVIIMGSILEVGKITTTVWLRKYWHRAGWAIKMYLVPAVVALALLTSMGIFGFLSKAHMDSGITSGDVTAKVALYDEKIKTERDNIELARKALQQMDAQVDQRLSRSDSENAAERAVAIRKQQSKERAQLQKDISDAQKNISKLNEERAPIASELRKVEAEVGPIKYIAALIYGDNADQNMLESAVRWMIILLVLVFDPLAIALVLAANQSKDWDDEPEYEQDDGPINPEVLAQLQARANEELPTGDLVVKTELFPDIDEANRLIDELEKEVTETIIPHEPMKFVDAGEHPLDYDETAVEEPVVEVKEEKSILEEHPYLTAGFAHFSDTKPMVYKPEPEVETHEISPNFRLNTVSPSTVTFDIQLPIQPAEMPPIDELTADSLERPGDYVTPPTFTDPKDVVTEGVTKENPLEIHEDGYVTFEGRHMSKDALKGMRPDLFALQADSGRQVSTNFGTSFPKVANKGDIFVRVDMLPNRVYKFSSGKWIEVNKEHTDSYLHDQKYVEYLVQMIENGQYDLDLLSDTEREQVAEYLQSYRG